MFSNDNGDRPIGVSPWVLQTAAEEDRQHFEVSRNQNRMTLGYHFLVAWTLFPEGSLGVEGRTENWRCRHLAFLCLALPFDGPMGIDKIKRNDGRLKPSREPCLLVVQPTFPSLLPCSFLGSAWLFSKQTWTE